MGDADASFFNASHSEPKSKAFRGSKDLFGGVETLDDCSINTCCSFVADDASKIIRRGGSLLRSSNVQNDPEAFVPDGDLEISKHEVDVEMYVAYVILRALTGAEGNVTNHRLHPILVKKDSDAIDGRGRSPDPVFSATDEAYLQVIDDEIARTFENNEHESANASPEITSDERCQSVLSMTESDSNDMFEMAAEHFLNSSLPEEEDQVSTSSDKPPPYQYEFEVDCESGMVCSRQCVNATQPCVEDGPADASDDTSECNFEYDDDNSSLAIEEVLNANVTEGTTHSFVELPPDVESDFEVIIDDETCETVYDVVDSPALIATKASTFRSRSPTKLPRAIRRNTDSSHRRCYSVNDTECYKYREISSDDSSHLPDTFDRIYTLPSPPRKSLTDTCDRDNSSFHGKMRGIPTLSFNRCNDDFEERQVSRGSAKSSTPKATNTETPHHDREPKQMCGDTNDQGKDWSLPDDSSTSDVNLNPMHQISLNSNERRVKSLSVLSIQPGCGNFSTSTTPSCTDELRTRLTPDKVDEAIQVDVGELSSSLQQLPRRHITKVSGDERLSQDTRTSDTPDGPPYYKLDKIDETRDEEVNIFEHIRRRCGRLSYREANELMTDLDRQNELMSRMINDTHRVQDEYLDLRRLVLDLTHKLDAMTSESGPTHRTLNDDKEK